MRAGVLDSEITVERKSVTTDPTYGTEIIDWVPLVALPGSPVVAQRFRAQVVDMVPSKAMAEAVQSGMTLGRQQTRIRLRYRTDLDSSMRVRLHDDTGRLLQIVSGPAYVYGRREMIELLCESFSTAGA